MHIPQLVDIPIAQYKSILQYNPQIGDFIIWHGWFTHYFGFITKIDNNQQAHITYAGLPYLLLTQDDNDRKNKTISIMKIKNSKTSYSILQNNIWYI